MKKWMAALLAVILILSCLSLSACSGLIGLLDRWLGNGGDDGYGDNGYGDNSDHTHRFESYFTYSECTVEGCKVVGRTKSQNTYANDFKYTLTSAKIKEINDVYSEMLTYLQDGDDYDQFEALYVDYVDYLDYVGHQYQVSSILNDVTYNATTTRNYKTASELYNEMFANYYALYELVYNSNYRDSFYEGWDEDEIQEALYYAKIYGGSADNNNAVDEILSEYEEFMDGLDWSLSKATTEQWNTLNNLYGKLVVANNNIAKSYDKYDNYMDYAYENEYNRDYKPSDVAEKMRVYVKEYVAPIFVEVGMKYHMLSYHGGFSSASSTDKAFYNGLMYDSLFTSTSNKNFDRVKTTIDYVSEYFEYMNRPKGITGGDAFDFSSAVEDLFKNGNYFTGDYEGAYTWWIDAIQKPILYFGEGYDTAFTFVHEFGHYYNNIYNGSMHLSYDQDETHSQGNEMLFLAWLSQHKPSGISTGFEMVEIEQLFDMLTNIVISTAVDEFEQAAYAGEYNGQPITSYSDLFKEILGSYKGTYEGEEKTALNFLNTSYWGYVVFSSSAYYISYAMSALPSIEIYAKAMSSGIGNGLYNARDSYVKLFTFANSSDFVTTSNGKKYLKSDATYEKILNYCGLQGPFQEGLYTSLKSYFDTRTDLK